MRILIADDDATSRLMLKAMTTKLGHECLVANDGLTAWAMLSSQGGIDVLLTDWIMPGVDGPELCRRVRHELSGSYIYIVLITGLGQRDQVLEGMSAGADDYLIKPVDPFAVQTRLVAAERVTALHRQVVDFQTQLEEANLELLARSLTDALTGLANRRHMDQDLARTHAQAQRSTRPFAIALFDIDHFKLYNDNYGHPTGDEALRQVADCLHQTVRQGETIYRYGGEEFLVLLADCDLHAAAAAAERIRQAVADTAIPHLARPTGPGLVTLSGGVTSWTPQSAPSVAQLLSQADQALYQAKTSGRNRVQIAPETPDDHLHAMLSQPQHGLQPTRQNDHQPPIAPSQRRHDAHDYVPI
jgi:two-component system, cell cycle response regulator